MPNGLIVKRQEASSRMKHFSYKNPHLSISKCFENP